MAAWIVVTTRLKKGLKIIDRVDSGKFRLLVNRICQSLQSGSNTKVFSAEEEEKLSISLDLNKDDLSLLLDTVTLIYTQAAYSIVKPAVMEAYMKDPLNIEDDKVVILLNAWVMYAKGIIDVLRQKSIFHTQVNDINWSLNMQSSSSGISKEARPLVLLQLGLTGTPATNLTVEMNKQDLSTLYQNLEKIQAQLDALK
ncbi:COMM domain-containing protein 10 isoform X2 [Cephus cinctus]|uniref:COMM domain-containing protein 10 isoform X2 n=1 Tax=Cephus cinctus TaxID=211228 RepID=A0AAJ7FKP9_CEPCN|nr:COMM domain-containing protein 10 isoform X2 [Cephus cinctus]